MTGKKYQVFLRTKSILVKSTTAIVRVRIFMDTLQVSASVSILEQNFDNIINILIGNI